MNRRRVQRGTPLAFRRAGRAALFAIAALLLVPPSPGTAQSQDDPERLSRQEMQARIVRQFERRLSRELRLDRQQVEEVQRIQQEMLGERRDLFQRQRALRRKLANFEEENGSEATAREILSETRALRSEEARIEAEEEARLLEVLTPVQVVRFKLLREELNDRIRRLHRGDGGPSGRSESHREDRDRAPSLG